MRLPLLHIVVPGGSALGFRVAAETLTGVLMCSRSRYVPAGSMIGESAGSGDSEASRCITPAVSEACHYLLLSTSNGSLVIVLIVENPHDLLEGLGLLNHLLGAQVPFGFRHHLSKILNAGRPVYRSD